MIPLASCNFSTKWPETPLNENQETKSMLKKVSSGWMHLTTWLEGTKIDDILSEVMSPPKKHNFETYIHGFDFDVVNMEDDSFFLEDRF